MNWLRSLVTAAALVFFPTALWAQMSFPLVSGPSISEGSDVLLTIELTDETADEAFAQALALEVGAEMLAIWPLRSIGLICYVFRAEDGDAITLAQRLAEDVRVVTAEPIRRYATLAQSYDDELFPIQDALHQLKIPQAHDRTRGAGAMVAVIDTGVAVDHPDLIGHDLTYRDFVRQDGSQDAERHGTAVAAIIGADGRNGVGMVGVAPEASILPLRACWEDEITGAGRCNSFTLARALNVALIEGADVINLSLSGPPDPLIERLIEIALDEGRIVVAAASGHDTFPATLPGVIAVSDISRPGHLTAPGTDVISATPEGGYDFFSGSSISTAFVSGIAALAVSAGKNDSSAIPLAAFIDGCKATGAPCD